MVKTDSPAVFFKGHEPTNSNTDWQTNITLSADSPERMDVMFVDKLLLEDHLH